MTETTKETCANCTAELRGTGPSSGVLSKRYCMKRSCQTAKQRAYRATQRHGSEESPMERRPCFHCGDELPARPSRITDHPAGRWCPKSTCQRDRLARLPVFDEAASVREANEMPSMDLQRRIAVLARKSGLLRRVVCAECNEPNAVRNYRHPLPEGGNCKALGDFPALRPDIEAHRHQEA